MPSPTPPPSRTIAAHHVRSGLRGVRRAGLSREALLAAAGIPASVLTDDRVRVPPERFTTLVQSVWDALDDEYAGLGAVPSRRGTFGTMGRLAVHCASLGQALERGAGFYGLFDGGPRFGLRVTRAEARFTVAVGPYDEDHFLAESLLVIWHRLAAWLVGTPVPLLAVELEYPAPEHAAEYDLMFGCPLVWSAPTTALVLDPAVLAAPVVRDEGAWRDFLRHSPADLLARRTEETTAGHRVRRALAAGLPRAGARRGRGETADLPDLETVSAALAVSPAHLRRLLRAEGTSYSEIKDELRRDAAIEALTSGDEPVESLSARLGFSEPSAFHRAFRRWTGTSPGAYRVGA